MASHDVPAAALTPQLEAIASAAEARLQAQAGEQPDVLGELQQRVMEAASAAIAAGESLTAIADAEQQGEQRARGALSTDFLRRVARSAKRKREADADYEQDISRAVRLGLSHREIAQHADVTHATIRAIATRTETAASDAEPHLPHGVPEPGDSNTPEHSG